MDDKKTVILSAFIITIVLLVLILIDNVKSCHYNYDGYVTLCMTIFGSVKELLAPLVASFLLAPFILIFSIITYKMEDKVFYAWWSFARWWVVAIIAVTLFIEYASGGSSGMGVGGAITGGFNILIESILYAIMIIGSLVKIVKTYLKTRTHK